MRAKLALARAVAGGFEWHLSIDSQDTLNFSARTGVRPMIEEMPLEKANEGALSSRAYNDDVTVKA